MKKAKIKDIESIVIHTGQIMSRVVVGKEENVESKAKVKVLIPKAINPDGTISLDQMPEEYLKVLPDKRRLVEIEDIVMKLSPPYDAAIVEENVEGVLAPSFCAIIKCTGAEVLPRYLLAFLNSELCKEQLRQQVAGVTMPMLSMGKIGEVEMPIPSLGIQRKVEEGYRKSQKQLELLREITELTRKRNDAIFREIDRGSDEREY